MSGAGDADGTGDTNEDGNDESAPSFEEGRYVFCVVDVTGSEADGFAVDGIADGRASLVVADGLGAVVQPRTAPFDSAAPTEIKRWLLAHQRVVDDAGDRFGTALPFRFDTVFEGDDGAVRAWLREERAELRPVLDRLAGRDEYRVEVVYDEERAREEIAAADDRLAELRAEIDAAADGTAFLLEKKYDRRLESLLADRRSERAADLADRLAPLADGFVDLGDRPSLGLDLADDGDGETLARFALLADDEAVDAVGDALDEVTSDPGVEVRFTGPWPPYSFAPSFGDVGAGDDDPAASRR
jgi:hypothetical protein